MKFTRINLQNYRQYKNAQFDLDNKLNIIIGQNGIGKSTLMSAIIFALYGIDEVSNTSLLDSIEYLANVDNYKDGRFIEKETVVTLDIEIEIEDEVKQYEITRIFDNYRYMRRKQYKSTNYLSTNYETVVAKEITNYKKNDVENINDITKFIPANIVPLLFFDGERIKSIESVIDSNLTGKTEFREEIERILQIETLNKAKSLISDTERHVSKNIISTIESEKIKTLTKKEIELKDTIDSVVEKKEKSIKRKEEIEEELKILKERLKKNENAKKYRNKIDDLQSELTNWGNQLENYDTELRSNLFEYGHQIASKSIFSDLYEIVSTTEGVYEISGIEQKAIDHILKNEKCICGNPICEDMKTTLLHVKKGLPPESFESMLKSEISSGVTIEEMVEKNSRLKANYLQISRDIQMKEEQKKKLSNEILKLDDAQSVNDEKRFNELEIEKSEMEKNASKCDGILLSKQEDLNTVLLELNHEKAKEKSAERELMTARYLSETKDYINNAIKAKQADISRNLQEKINENAKLLVRDSIKIKIDEKLKPTCQFVGGSTSLSSGQSVMVSLSYLISLMQIAKEQSDDSIISQNISYPVVMDGITAALDSEHIKNMIESVINTQSQLIFFVNDQTITELEEAILDTLNVESIEDKKIYIYREIDTNETIVEVKKSGN